MQDVGEEPAGAPERIAEGTRDRPQDETPRGELREIGNERSDEVADLQLAGLHELAHGILGRPKGADEALADVAADLAGLRGVVRQRGGDRLPAGDGPLGARLGRGGGRPSRGAGLGGGPSGRAEGVLEPVGGVRGRLERRRAVRSRARHRVLQRLPGGHRARGGLLQHAGRLGVARSATARVGGHPAEKVRRLDIGAAHGGAEGISRGIANRRGRAGEGVLDPAQLDRV